MSMQTLKLFYKGSKLSTVHSGSAHFTVVSANHQNLCETTNQTTPTQLLATDAQGNPEEDFPNLVKYADPVARVFR